MEKLSEKKYPSAENLKGVQNALFPVKVSKNDPMVLTTLENTFKMSTARDSNSRT